MSPTIKLGQISKVVVKSAPGLRLRCKESSKGILSLDSAEPLLRAPAIDADQTQSLGAQ